MSNTGAETLQITKLTRDEAALLATMICTKKGGCLAFCHVVLFFLFLFSYEMYVF